MTITTSPFNNQYYPLPVPLDPAAPVASPRPIDFSAILASTDDSLFSSSNDNSDFQDVLALSSQAQDLLSQSATNATDILGSGFVAQLSDAQLQQVVNILAQFKDEPVTQENFNKIQDELRAQGLAPDQLALQQRVEQFDPAGILLDSLTDTDTGTASTTLSPSTSDISDATLQAEAQSYMQQIFLLWQSLSGNVVGNVPLFAA